MPQLPTGFETAAEGAGWNLAALTDLLPVGVYTCDAPSGVIRYYNSEAARLWGRAPALGDTDVRFCGSFRLFRPDGSLLPHDRTPMARVIAGDPPVRDQKVVIERPDGSRVTVMVKIDPILDPSGELVGAVNVFQDVSDRDRLFEQSRERAEELEKLMDVMPVAVWIARDAECRTITGNRAGNELLRMGSGSNLSRSAPGAPSLPFRVVVEGREVAADQLPMQYAAAHGKEVRDVEEEIVFADGSAIQVFGSATPLFDEMGRVRGSIGAFMNVSELRRLDRELRRKVEELAESDHRKNQFLAILAHELRNPLAPIRNALELLRLADDDAETRRRARGLMERQLGQMVRLIDDLLDVARITTSKLRLRQERVRLAAVLDSAIEAVAPVIEAAGHRLEVTLPDETLPAGALELDADPARLAQAFTNLLSNASKYTAAGGRIAVTVGRDGDAVTVSVRDSGIGIAAADLPRIFELFSQVKPAADRSDGGLGIGLSLVRTVIELHGGEVVARSDGPGRGSEFVVRLPIAADRSRPAPADDGRDAERATAKRRILVADDNRDAAESLAALLALQGYEVETAFDGEATARAAAQFRPEVALLDIGMPGMDGYEVARLVRREPWGRGVVLVAVTGWGQEEDRRRALDAGFDHHLVKPVHPADLKRLLGTIAPAGSAAGS